MRRAILTHRRVMDVIGHNIANAATPGYSRQRAILKTTEPYSYPGMNSLVGAGQVGTGVVVASIERVRDLFVDSQIRIGTSNQSQLEIEQSTLERIEAAFMEPSTTEGLSDVLSEFYDAWEDLMLDPDSTAVRQVVVSKGQNLVDVINHIDQQLRDIRSDLNAQLREDITEVNRILYEIADLNGEIAKVLTHGDQPNDLMDTRDLLLDELSEYMDITVSTTNNDMVSIHVGSRQLLWDTSVQELSDGLAWDHPSQQSQTPYFSDVSQADFSMLAKFMNGEIKGILNSRDEYVPEVQEKFQTFVSTFMDEINAAHSSAFGLQAFAQDLAINTTSDIVITPPVAGTGDNSVTVSSTNNITVGDYFRIEETDAQDGDGVLVKVTSISGNTVFFQTLEDLTLKKSYFSGDPLATYQVDSGAKIYKIGDSKYNFFDVNLTLPHTFIGDADPDYTSTMISTIELDESIGYNTTFKELANIFGLDITNDILSPNGRTIYLDNVAQSITFTENTTLGDFLQRINEVCPPTSDGENIELSFDEINHRIILKGSSLKALEELGGENGSDLNLFRILGFEGEHMTGFELTPGTTLDGSTLSEFGVSDGWFMVDGVNLYADSSISIQANLDNWNSALRVEGSTSFNTEIMYDTVERRLKIISDHQFSVRDSIDRGFAAPFIKSNILTTLGFREADGTLAFSAVQQKASITTSDIGARIKVNDALVGNANLIAAARSEAGAPGDNAAAVLISGTRSKLVLNDTGIGVQMRPSQTLEEYYDSAISSLGTDAQRATVDLEVVENYLAYYEQKREEVSGVSIDEEMTKMIEAQHAFSAASRMINVIDEMLERIINGMGLAGR